MRLDNISLLQLPHQWSGLIDPIIYNNRMEMDLWMEGVSDTYEWIQGLRRRGYKEVSNVIRPELWLSTVKTSIPDHADLVYKGRKPAKLAQDVLLRLSYSMKAK